MIPIPLFSAPMLIMLFIPLIAGVISAGLLLRALWWWLKSRHRTPRPRFWNWLVIVLTVLAVAGDLWGLVMMYQIQRIEDRIAQKNHYRQSRQNFILPQDFQYGEQLFPKGSLINRYDPYDNGEPQRPLGLRGLRAARFPAPVQIAGAWVSAIDTHGELELASDQHLSPVFHFDPDTNKPYGAWVPDPTHPYLDCHAGDIAHYHAPTIDYDVEAEFISGPPDGAQARFRPSQWGFVECVGGGGRIGVEGP